MSNPENSASSSSPQESPWLNANLEASEEQRLSQTTQSSQNADAYTDALIPKSIEHFKEYMPSNEHEVFSSLANDFLKLKTLFEQNPELAKILYPPEPEPEPEKTLEEIVSEYQLHPNERKKINAQAEKIITSLRESTNPIEQLNLLSSAYDVFLQCNPFDDTGESFRQIKQTFKSLKEQSTPPLVHIVSTNMLRRSLDDSLALGNKFLGSSSYDAIGITATRRSRREKIQKQQEQLHQEFPNISPEQTIVKVAPGVAAITDQNLHLKTFSSDALDEESTTLLQAAHDPEIRYIIDHELSLDLSSISLDSQIQLLKYMTEADSTRYENLCSTLKNTPTIIRKKLAEAFLSADFGPDFGDSLLAIANSDHFSPDQIADILISVDSCRSSIKIISNLYSQIDNGTFAEQYSRAANERLTDALTVFREIAEHGSTKANLGWAGQTNFSYESALEALNYEKDSLSIISGTMDDVISGKDGAFAEQVLSPDADHDRSLYNFYSPNHGYVLLYTRPEGSSTFDPMVEYGKFRSKFAEQNNNAGVEASISFITNPIDPFSLPNPYRPDRKKTRDPNYYDSPTMDKVSAIRLDREGRTPDAPPDDPNRSPINPTGIVSVDLAAIGDRPDTPSGKIARLFSTGNKLREQSRSTDFNLNHNTHWFDQDSYGSSSGFKRLTNYIQSNADVLCLLYPPSKDSVSFSSASRSARQSKRRRQRRPHYPVRPAA